VSERVIVVGAGIAGLTAAYRLVQQGHEVTVLEADAIVGGRMASIERDGYRMDLAAVSLSDKYTQMHDLIRDVGIADQVVSCPDLIGIPKDGEMHRLHSASARKVAMTGLLSWRSKLAAARLALDGRRLSRVIDWDDLGAAEGFDEETARDWVLRRGNAEIEYVTDAVVRGGLMTRSDRMSALDLQFLMVSFFGAGLFTFPGGVGVLPEALAARLDVRLGTRVTEVEEHAGGVRVSSVTGDGGETTEDASACVITLNAHQMAAIHPQLPAEHRAIVDATDYVRLITISLALDRRPAEPSMFLALAERVDPDLCGIFLDHNRHPSRVPPGAGLATAFWHHDWNTREWETPDEEIVERTVEATARLLPGLDSSVVFSNVKRWDAAFIYSRPGTYKALHTIAASRPAARRIHLAGDYFGGPSTNTSLCSGEFAAAQVARSLRAVPVPA
jgi:oxygen-dependent protoporphyrinogen oxidase